MKVKNLIIGKNCLKEVLKFSPERIITIYTAHEKDDEVLKGLRMPIVKKSRKQLDDMSNSTSHQGYAAEVTRRENVCIEDMMERANEKEKSLVVVLDSIFDPQNVGSILRAAECFGVDGVIISKHKGCKITPTVTKTSVGASEIIPIAEVSSLASTIEKFKKEGFWVVASEINEKASPLNTFEFPEKTLLILGSEGKGVGKNHLKNSDFHVYIPMFGRVDSLNVSQAAAVMFSFFNK